MKKLINTFSELLVLFLVIGVSIALVGVEFSEQNKTSNLEENTTNLNENSTELELAPENPEFVRSQNNEIFTQVTSSQGEQKTGLVPAPVNLNYLSNISNADVSASASYDMQDVDVSMVSNTQSELSAPAYYDLRNLNRVTTVKDQGSAGVCWAFASYASLESALMSGEDLDFSENNMKNLLSSAYPEGFDRNSYDGGNQFTSTAYLARWSGPVVENDDPYNSISTSSPTGLAVQKHVQDVLFLPDRQGSLDNDKIKLAVQKYGAVFTSMYYDNACYSPNKYSYYYNGYSGSNHAVAIVGWNDSFDRNSFSRVPPGNGAFIIKNSWGTGWGENGYFYISYYDSNIGTYNSVFTAESPDNYKSIYQYDPLGWIQSIGYRNPVAWCANIFTAKSDETLKAVSFYTTDSNCNYEIYIYTNPGSTPISQVAPVLSKSGICPIAGYHTIPLGSDVQFKAGQEFSVVLKLTTPEFNYPIAVEIPYSGWSSKATANPGESFVSSNGNTWTDITTVLSNTSICIKAFTVPESLLPVANFSATTTSGNTPLSVAFTDTSTGTPTSWTWSFGDGTSSTDKNPVHTYTTAGKYTVSLTVKNEAGSNAVTKSSYINPTNSLMTPVASFSASSTSGNTPLKVTFTDTSKGNPTSWNWNFGDGKSSTEKSPTHTYSTAGSYTVQLTVSNAAGNNTAIKSTYIKVAAVRQKPVASFSSNTTSGSAPLNVAFTDTSTGTPTSWTWSFGDGTSSTAKNPVHTYNKAGKYTVSLIARNAMGSNAVTKSGYLTVVNALKAPVASFSATPVSGNAPMRVTFTDKSTGTPTSWNWNFGDGTFSTTRNPTHTYSRAGKYAISLTVTNAAGSNVATKSSYINVATVLKTSVTAAFSASPTSGNAPLKVTFTDKSTGTPTSWKWSFGDSTSSTAKNPVHTYSKTGNYTVVLTVKNSQSSHTVAKSGFITVTNK